MDVPHDATVLSAVCDCGVSLSYSLLFLAVICEANAIFSSGGHFVHQSGTVSAILVDSIMRNISVKLFCIWASGLDRLYNLVEGIIRNNHVKSF